jgi:hypothetical protein
MQRDFPCLHRSTRAPAFLVSTFDASIPTPPHPPTTPHHIAAYILSATSATLFVHLTGTAPLHLNSRTASAQLLPAVFAPPLQPQSASSRALSSTTPTKTSSSVSCPQRTTLDFLAFATRRRKHHLLYLRSRYTAEQRTAFPLTSTIQSSSASGLATLPTRSLAHLQSTTTQTHACTTHYMQDRKYG